MAAAECGPRLGLDRPREHANYRSTILSGGQNDRMETVASRARRERIARAVPAYASNPAVAAILLAGSAARGHADRFSDIELGVFWRRPPDDDERAAAIAAAGGDLERVYPFDPSDGCWLDDWKLGRRDGEPRTGFSVESVHMTLVQLDETLASVLERYDPDPGKQLVLSALLHGISLHGPGTLESRRAAVTDYPDALAHAVVAAHAQIDHFWRFDMFRERGNVLLAARARADIQERLLHVLLGVNRSWYAGFKSLEAVTAGLTIAPPDILDRLRRSDDAASSKELLGPLVEETYDLVERHVAGIDVERLRSIFRYQRPLWDEGPDG